MFKTFYGLAFKHYFINSETLELYRNKYISNIVYGWFLIVSVDGGATWEEVKHISSGILEIRYKNYLIGLISDVEESEESLNPYCSGRWSRTFTSGMKPVFDGGS